MADSAAEAYSDMREQVRLALFEAFTIDGATGFDHEDAQTFLDALVARGLTIDGLGPREAVIRRLLGGWNPTGVDGEPSWVHNRRRVPMTAAEVAVIRAAREATS